MRRSAIPSARFSSTPQRPPRGRGSSSARSTPASTSTARSRSRRRSTKRCASRGCARERGVKNGIVHDKLFLPGFLKLRRLRRQRLLRAHPERARRVRLLGVRGDVGPAPQRPSWNYRDEDGGGVILDMFPHWSLRARVPDRAGARRVRRSARRTSPSASTRAAASTKRPPTTPPTASSSSRTGSSRRSTRRGTFASTATSWSSSRSTARTAARSLACATARSSGAR